jgi:hypothetical protein
MTEAPQSRPARIPRPHARGSMRRRDLFLLVGLALAVVAFSAISITINALRPDVPTTSNSTTADPRVLDSDFVVRLGSRVLPDTPQAELLALGRDVCAQFDAGASAAAVSSSLESQGLTSAQGDAVIGAAVEAYCPAHRPALNG